MLGCEHAGAVVEESLSGGLPGELGFHAVAGGLGEVGRLGGMLEEAIEAVSEVFGGVRKQQILAGAKRESLGSNGGGDDGDAHGHGFKNLDAGAAAGEQGHGDGGAGMDVGLDLGDGAGDFDQGIGTSEGANAGRRVAPDDLEAERGVILAKPGQNLMVKPEDTFDVGHPVHGAQEPDGRVSGGSGGRMEAADIDSGGHVAEDVGELVVTAAEGGVLRGDGDDAVEAQGEGFFGLPHATVLGGEVSAFERMSGAVGEAFPDLGFDVVLEEEGGDRQGREVEGGGEEIADDEIGVGGVTGDGVTPGGGLVAVENEGQPGEERVAKEFEKEGRAGFGKGRFVDPGFGGGEGVLLLLG